METTTTMMRMAAPKTHGRYRRLQCDAGVLSATINSEDLHAQGRERKLGAQLSGRVPQIQCRIHFDDVERAQTARFGDQLHQQMCFAIVQPALDRRAYAGCDRGVADVEVKRNMDTCSAGR